MSNNKIITAAISAVLALGTTTILAANENMQMMGDVEGMEKCYGIAKAGQNDCGTVSHACAGEAKVNSDKSEWVAVPSGVCNKIVGGSTTYNKR